MRLFRTYAERREAEIESKCDDSVEYLSSYAQLSYIAGALALCINRRIADMSVDRRINGVETTPAIVELSRALGKAAEITSELKQTEEKYGLLDDDDSEEEED